MEVTKSNFAELCPEIEEALRSCSFLAVDGEFTGLNNGPNNISPFDSPAEYYAKVLSGSMDFLFVQFGLSIFRHLSDFKYENKTYVFYLFPDPANRQAPDRRFLCQTSSLSFLAKHGFDFNKLIREGIPYLKPCDESALREAMETRRKLWEQTLGTPQTHIDIPAAQKPLVDEVITQIKELLDPNCDKPEVRVEKCSAFVRKLVYQTVREELSDSGISVKTEKGVLVARKIVEKEQLEMEKRKKAEEDDLEINNAVGFVRIIKTILNSNKLMVGHNFLLDLCHIVEQFVDRLPQDYLQFKDMVKSLFPKIIDTKFLCSEGPLKDLFPSTVLSALMETVSKPPFQLPEITAPEGRGVRQESENYHDSGYDAYVTGICFLSSLRYLESNGEKVHSVNSPLLNKILNRLHLMRIPDTCINLGGKDPEPPRDHVFHVTFPKTWTSEHLNQFFSPFGLVHVSWISDTKAWVSLHDRSQSDRAKQILRTKSPKLADVTVLTHAQFQASFAPSPSPMTSRTYATSSTPTTTKRKLQESEGQWQEAGVQQNNKKQKQRSSSIHPSEANDGKTAKVREISKLETASAKASSNNFPVDDNWD
uniref:Poly(A)-specific ribonuclease PARN n=1 Tax=Lygus hesperus TaxID=30085 RepID=A0A146M4P1_LYGHE